MKLNATVVWSINVTVEVPDNATEDDKREAILSSAEKDLTGLNKPIIHECSDPDLID